MGETPKQAKEVVAKMKQALLRACEDLHKSGGLVDVQDDGKGSLSFTEKPEGLGGCK